MFRVAPGCSKIFMKSTGIFLTFIIHIPQKGEFDVVVRYIGCSCFLHCSACMPISDISLTRNLLKHFPSLNSFQLEHGNAGNRHSCRIDAVKYSTALMWWHVAAFKKPLCQIAIYRNDIIKSLMFHYADYGIITVVIIHCIHYPLIDH